MTEKEREFYMTLLNNLLFRMDINKDGKSFKLVGTITADEIQGLRLAIEALRYAGVYSSDEKVMPSGMHDMGQVRTNSKGKVQPV